MDGVYIVCVYVFFFKPLWRGETLNNFDVQRATDMKFFDITTEKDKINSTGNKQVTIPCIYNACNGCSGCATGVGDMTGV